LYDGSLRNKARIPAEWQQARKVLRRENNTLPPAWPPDRQPNSQPPPQPASKPVQQPRPQPRSPRSAGRALRLR
jgi:hypothetical protein